MGRAGAVVPSIAEAAPRAHFLKIMQYEILKNRKSAQELFLPFKDDAFAFLLESTRSVGGMGRYSFFGSSPFLVAAAGGGRAAEGRPTEPFGPSVPLRMHSVEGPTLALLQDLLDKYRFDERPLPPYPFLGGAVGFLSYDFGLTLEGITRKNRVDSALPGWLFAFYDVVVCLDKYRGEVAVFSSGLPEQGRARAQKARLRLKETVQKIGKTRPLRRPLRADEFFPGSVNLTSNFSKAGYLSAVRRAKAYITSGDIYQVNLSQMFRARAQMDDWMLYQRLSRSFPVSFAAFLKTSDFSIISASPERFLNFEGGRVSTRPMKGTARRMGSPAADRITAHQLRASRKERAELLMIVDLERNDLGRVCDYGTIRVRHPRQIERYRSVFQATAEIEGVLHKGKDRIDLLRACFPGGSVTGCPKIRAMEIIEELEPDSRGVYTGALGYLSFHDTLQFSVLIRSFLKQGDLLSFHVGGGIVSDSRPEDEYEETLIKAQGLNEALGARQV